MDSVEVDVERVESVYGDTVAMTLEAPSDFEGLPGQFVRVACDIDGESVTRHYTLSSPYTDGSFEITVGVDPDGELSPELASMDRGDSVMIDGPYGQAYYEGEDSVIVLAGGPGVGPAVGIAERVARENGASGVGVVYRDREPAHTGRLDALRDAGATVEVVGEDGDLARPTEDVFDTVASRNGEDLGVFVYGFADFLNEALDALDAVGYDDEPKYENFG